MACVHVYEYCGDILLYSIFGVSGCLYVSCKTNPLITTRHLIRMVD
jgi:hypothetical protein